MLKLLLIGGILCLPTLAQGDSFSGSTTLVKQSFSGDVEASGSFQGDSLTIGGELSTHGSASLKDSTVGSLSASGSFYGENVKVNGTIDASGSFAGQGISFTEGTFSGAAELINKCIASGPVRASGSLRSGGSEFQSSVTVEGGLRDQGSLFAQDLTVANRASLEGSIVKGQLTIQEPTGEGSPGFISLFWGFIKIHLFGESPQEPEVNLTNGAQVSEVIFEGDKAGVVKVDSSISPLPQVQNGTIK